MSFRVAVRGRFPLQTNRISHTPPTHTSVGNHQLSNLLLHIMDLQDLAQRHARNPRLILVQLFIEALRAGHVSRQDLSLFQDVSCAVLSICGTGWVNECLLELFIASYGVVMLAVWTIPQIPDSLAPLHIPMNPGRGVSLQPLSRIVLGPFRESIAFKAAAMLVPLGHLILTFERTWPDARFHDPLYKLMLRTLMQCTSISPPIKLNRSTGTSRVSILTKKLGIKFYLAHVTGKMWHTIRKNGLSYKGQVR